MAYYHNNKDGTRTRIASNQTFQDTPTETLVTREEFEQGLVNKMDKSYFSIAFVNNLFDYDNSKPNFAPNTSTFADYDDGTYSATRYTTNLIDSSDNKYYKININREDVDLLTIITRVVQYNSSKKVIRSGYPFTIDDDGYYKFSVSDDCFYFCIFIDNETLFNAFIISHLDVFEPFDKTIVNDLYLSDDNVKMAKKRLSLTDNVLYGKKWCTVGDSFTAGNWSTDLPKITDGKYAGKRPTYQYLIANRNLMSIQDLSLGGRTLAKPSDSYTNTFIDNYQNVAEDANYLTIYLGINDSTNENIQIGTITDDDTSTFYGAWNTVLSWLISNRPDLKIGIIVSNACSDDSYRTATISIANKYGLPYIDLNGDSRTPCMLGSTNATIDSTIRTNRTNHWRRSPVDIHPNEECHAYESTFIENFLRSL